MKLNYWKWESKMSVSITAKLNKAANEFQAGESIGFGLRLGQQYYDRETKQREWTNYECVIFAKQQSQIDFYRQMLVEGAIVAVSGKEQKIRSFDGNNGTILSIEIMNASLDNVFGAAGSPQAQPQQQQAPAQPAPQPQSFGSFDTDWSGYKPSATTNGATIEQVKKKYNGDLQAAIKNGHVEVDGNSIDDQIPF